MKRIILCFDGTWNTPADEAIPEAQQVETNVRRFYRSISPAGPDGAEQVKWYNEGVGTFELNKLAGGAFGAGLDLHILSGYQQLVNTYNEGDEVYVLGFSRGAYTRSLVGMIRNCGLVHPGLASPFQIGTAYGIYRARQEGPDSVVARSFRACWREISIRFLGVWDTVGALGIPLSAARRLDNLIYEFHDTQLSKIVERAFQAIALDEQREDFDITLWTPTEKPAQILEQRWFVGSHSDVGGGYPNRMLSDLALRWMQDRATDAGLGLTPVAVGEQNDLGPSTDSFAQFLAGLYAATHQRHIRPVLTTQFGHEVLDPTIDRRRHAAALAYRPTNPGLPALIG